MANLDSGDETAGPSRAQPALDPCILVVDDHSQLRRTLARALTEARYAVLEAEDGVLALQILERGGVDLDLVLTDLRMPRLDGVELGRRIAERAWRIPVLYMSGGPGDALGADGVGWPITPLLRKPFSMDTLLGVVDRLLRGRRAGQPAVEGCPAPA